MRTPNGGMKVMSDGSGTMGLNGEAACAPSDARLLAEIGRSLRSAYDELVREPMPERIAALIAKLEYRDPAA